MFAAELSAVLRKHGLRGAYAEKLQAEWLGHYANLRDSLPAEEAIARLGSPEELAASAARSASACSAFSRSASATRSCCA